MIVGLTGRKRSGKSTAASYLVGNFGYTELSFAKPLKNMALAVNPVVGCQTVRTRWWRKAEVVPVYLQEVVDRVGWERAKDEYPEVRRFLQRLGTDGVRNHLGEDTWVDKVNDRILEVQARDPLAPIVLADVRFENEAELIRNHGGVVFEVVRDSQRHDEPEHASEAGVRADETVINVEGSPEELFSALDRLIGDYKDDFESYDCD